MSDPNGNGNGNGEPDLVCWTAELVELSNEDAMTLVIAAWGVFAVAWAVNMIVKFLFR